MISGFRASFSVELLKARRSKVFWLSIGAVALVPVMIGLMMLLVMHPELASRLKMLKTKTDLMSVKAEWPFFLGMCFQAVSAIGLIIFGFVTSWVFGREYSDRTVKDLLALPVSRFTIILSKYAAVAAWCSLLSAVIFLLMMAAGFAVGLPGWSAQAFLPAVKVYFVTVLLTILLCPPVGFFASLGRGYMAPIGFVMLVLALSNFIAITGSSWGGYFPWLVPALYSGATGPAGVQLGLPGLASVSVTCLLGIAGTWLQWQYSDQK